MRYRATQDYSNNSDEGGVWNAGPSGKLLHELANQDLNKQEECDILGSSARMIGEGGTGISCFTCGRGTTQVPPWLIGFRHFHVGLILLKVFFFIHSLIFHHLKATFNLLIMPFLLLNCT
jgi:hypothetical protein